MTQRKLKLTLWPTLFTIPALLVLVGLGTWQLQRMQWKSEIIDTFEERISDKAVAPPLKVTNIEKWRFKRVALMGKFMHQHILPTCIFMISILRLMIAIKLRI